MKRLNPKTGKPFKRGDIREDGKVFVTYQKTAVRADGTYKECWLSPDKFEAYKATISKAGTVCQRKRRAAQKEWVDELKVKAGCSVCGFNAHPVALDFDHIDRKDKSFDISQYVGTKSDEVILSEIAKCRVLCANCHRIKSYENKDHLKTK